MIIGISQTIKRAWLDTVLDRLAKTISPETSEKFHLFSSQWSMPVVFPPPTKWVREADSFGSNGNLVDFAPTRTSPTAKI
jgi:hypothetical protein